LIEEKMADGRGKEAEVLRRRGFGRKDEVAPELDSAYGSRLIRWIREQGNRLQLGRVTVLLAKEFGFCYGVERAIDYLYETRREFPGRRIYLLGEIVHNPYVNEKARAMGIEILDGRRQLQMDFSRIRPEDVVVLPAFGAREETVQKLRQRGCIIVDTTCGSVLSVWKRVEQYARKGFTTVVHGKFAHEETQATLSRVQKFPGAKFVVVKDKKEAGILCDAIRGVISAEVFLERLGAHASPGFDPGTDLAKIGIANQTTMLRSESMEIAAMIRAALADRYGECAVDEHFLNFDTICSATEDRQQAVVELIQQEHPDRMLVVGGFGSSNTGHLAEIASRFIPAYHVEGPQDLINAREIRTRDSRTRKVVVLQDWLPEGTCRIGLTSGASTPDSILAGVIKRLSELVGAPIPQV